MIDARRVSVFGRLVAIMAGMALCLLVLVAGFFRGIVIPSINRSVDKIFEDYVRTVAATSPDLERARELGARVGITVRYEGPDTSWSTAPGMPAIAAVRARGSPHVNPEAVHRGYVLAASPSGGTYLFMWNLGGRLFEEHAALLLLLLVLMVAVVFAAHLVLRHLLGPLRAFGSAAARLGEGELDARVPAGGSDEFGRLAEAFNRMAERVRAMIAARDHLLADVSHELRSPLTRMKVAVAMLPEGTRRDDIAADVGEMERMVIGLLELERLQARQGLVLERHDLMPLLREVAGPFRSMPPGVRIAGANGPLWADVDADRFRMVMRNLLDNARKYSLPDSRPIDIVTSCEDGSVLVRVTDDGVGIPEVDHGRVFEPFFRADPSRSRQSGGYGLGLAMCKRAMEAQAGFIMLASARPRGASFVISLPEPGGPAPRAENAHRSADSVARSNLCGSGSEH